MTESPLYLRLFEASPHPYLILCADSRFTIVAVNDKYLEATGTQREAIVGHGLFEIFPDNPDDHAGSAVGDLRASLKRVLADKVADTMGVQKYDIPRQDGSGAYALKYWSPVNTPVLDGAGQVEYVIHHVEDVTEFIVGRERSTRESEAERGRIEARAERMEAEVMRRATEVKDANRALKAAMEVLEQREAELARLNQRLTELDRLKTRFFANVSHELRTPLTLILAPLESRLRKPPGTDSEEEVRRENELMLRNARLLHRHVADLLDAAKLEAGEMNADWARLDLARLLRVMASHFESLAHDRGIAYRVDAPDSVVAEGDSEKLQRVLLNLLSNAFKFTPDGGEITVRLVELGSGARIEVRDTGPGVPADMREAVFERFQQVDSGTRRRQCGTGLGLSIVKDFVELHGGTVRIDEAPGGGALVCVALPLRAPAGTPLLAPVMFDPELDRQAIEALEAQPPDAIAASPADVRAPLVLVVEDNADMNAFIAAALRQHYRVARAFDGRDGLDKALALRPDLILTDVMMPTMGGDEMVLALRRHPEMVDVPIVMLTARADDELRVQLFKTGIQAWLGKPFAVDELLARVDGLLAERRRAAEQLRASEARYRELVESANSAIIHWSPTGTITFCNQFAQTLFGWRRDEIIGQHVGMLVPQTETSGADLSGLVAEIAAHPERYVFTDNENICRDGRRLWMSWTNRVTRDERGQVVGILAVGNDISARKQAEEELKRRNEELERFDRAAVGRELRMIELKRRVNDLSRQLGQTPPFDLSFADDAEAPEGGASA